VSDSEDFTWPSESNVPVEMGSSNRTTFCKRFFQRSVQPELMPGDTDLSNVAQQQLVDLAQKVLGLQNSGRDLHGAFA
jgi:hypothetical protein